MIPDDEARKYHALIDGAWRFFRRAGKPAGEPLTQADLDAACDGVFRITHDAPPELAEFAAELMQVITDEIQRRQEWQN